MKPTLKTLPLGVGLVMTVALPVSISISQSLSFLFLPCAWLLLRKRPSLPLVVAVPLILFLGAACLPAIGPAGSDALLKVYRFLSLGVIAAIPLVVLQRPDPRQTLVWFMQAYFVGVLLLALSDAVRIPLEISRGTGWFDTGNMRDPQFYAVAILCSVLAGVDLRWRRFRLPAWGTTAAAVLGLIFHFKRGAWIATGGVLFGVAALRRKVSILLGMAVMGGLSLLLPAVRDRLLQLKNIRDPRIGGRWSLWTEAAPSMIQDHPLGVGFKQSSQDLLRTYTENIQPHLDHLHNNVLQLMVELGWTGATAWIVFQAALAGVLIAGIRKASTVQSEGKAYAEGDILHACLAAFVALQLVGLVEYNVGDSEILILFSWLAGMGMAAVQIQAVVPEEVCVASELNRCEEDGAVS